MLSRELTISITDSIYVGICIIDSNFRVISWNDYLETYLQITREEIVGKKIGDFYPAFDEPRYKERIENIFKGWPPMFFSSTLNSLFLNESGPDIGTNLYQDVTISGVQDNENNETLALITINDVTDLTVKLKERNYLYNKAKEEVETRKKVEEMLRTSEQELTDLNSTKDQLLSIIAHDLRSPISTNINALDYLIKEHDTTSDERRKELLSLMFEGTRETYNLLEDLLTWARLQVTKESAARSIFQLKEMVEYEIRKIKHIADNKEIQISVDAFPENVVEADKNMIQTVLRNLVSNALKFTQRGGKINITCTTEDQWIHVHVEDTGMGIKPENLDKLFTLKSKYSTPGTDEEKGTGFGLVLCKEFMDKNHGMISVESTPGQGSTFTFSLPI